jgi:vancomycin permeability regulator SanA
LRPTRQVFDEHLMTIVEQSYHYHLTTISRCIQLQR